MLCASGARMDFKKVSFCLFSLSNHSI